MVDVGAGDGRFALELARDDPSTLAIALDASTDRLVDGARLARRHGVPNVLFVVSSIERLPDMLGGIADRATIHFPWGSLLGGVTRDDEAVLAPLARLLRIGGRLELVLQASDVAVDAFERHCLVLCERRPATAAEVTRTRSSWAKRLGIGPRRPAFVFRFERIHER